MFSEPMKVQPPAGAGPGAGGAGALPQSVLVVDDDAFVRGMLARQLAALGIERVAYAEDGASAAGTLATFGPFEAMICDLSMPGTDGVELMRQLSGLQPDLKVLLVSSLAPRLLAAAEDLAGAHNIRLLGCLPKPVHLGALRAALAARPTERRVSAGATPSTGVEVAALRAAIAEERIDILVQPQLDARTGRLCGVEALARWTEDGCAIGPDLFVRTAEKHGLMEDLTALVCRRALSACALWRRQGLSTRISVNFSADSLQHLDLPERLDAMIAACGIHPGQLVVEVTESVAMSNMVNALDVLARLGMRGIELSLDDFGSGYSSLTQLRSVPFAELKIDRGFVAAAARSATARQIVESSVRLAHSLQLRVVAEGLESQDDWNRVVGFGCDVVQGYGIARPMPEGELVAWARGRGAA